MSIDRGMHKEHVVHIYNEILLNHEKNEIGIGLVLCLSVLPFADAALSLQPQVCHLLET